MENVDVIEEADIVLVTMLQKKLLISLKKKRMTT